MSDLVIRVEGLGKKYRIRHQAQGPRYTALRDVVVDKVRALVRPSLASTAASTEDFWALKDVSFEVRRGEVVGIVGRNGAGKSTLLKILSRITEPTLGSVRLKGRVASLLEVGTGFHPELTGRENIYLNGAILGMSRAEIRHRFDEIVAFAEVETFLDTPVKRYSSGMYVRLAFAVAAHMEPEILVVDEVLAVGDAQFQKKSLGKMQEVGRGGRTVLFVSHNMAAISTLTQRVIVLQAGRVVADDRPTAAIGEYARGLEAMERVYVAAPRPDRPTVTRLEVITSEAHDVHVWSRPLEVRFVVDTPRPVRNICLSFQILNALQQSVLHLWTFDAPVCETPGSFGLTCQIPKLRLSMGRYSLRFFLSEPPGGDMFDTVEDLCPFEVVMHGHYRQFEWREDDGAYIEDFSWRTRELS